jgi:hypothetical protein
VDAGGRACLWQEQSGMLLRAAQLPVQPAAGAAVLLPGGHHAAVPCRLPGLSADGSAVSRAVEQQGFAVIDVRKLAVVDVATPASLLSLQKFWHPGVLGTQHAGCRIVPPMSNMLSSVDARVASRCADCADHRPDGQQPSGQPEVLAAKLLVSVSSEAIIVSLTEAGDLLTFLPDCPAGLPPPDACLEPAFHPHRVTSTGAQQ